MNVCLNAGAKVATFSGFPNFLRPFFHNIPLMFPKPLGTCFLHSKVFFPITNRLSPTGAVLFGTCSGITSGYFRKWGILGTNPEQDQSKTMISDGVGCWKMGIPSIMMPCHNNAGPYRTLGLGTAHWTLREGYFRDNCYFLERDAIGNKFAIVIDKTKQFVKVKGEEYSLRVFPEFEISDAFWLTDDFDSYGLYIKSVDNKTKLIYGYSLLKDIQQLKTEIERRLKNR